MVSNAKALAFMAAPAALLAHTALAQGPPTLGKAEDAYISSDTDKRPYNKRDFNGLWSRNPRPYGLPACPECADPGPWPPASYGFLGTPPPRTPEGERRFQVNKPGRGLELGSEEANRRTDLDIGMRRAVLPAFRNDPEARREPLGLARLIAFFGGGATMEMGHTPANDRIIQRVQWSWGNRESWLDGRTLANVDDYLPR